MEKRVLFLYDNRVKVETEQDAAERIIEMHPNAIALDITHCTLQEIADISLDYGETWWRINLNKYFERMVLVNVWHDIYIDTSNEDWWYGLGR